MYKAFSICRYPFMSNKACQIYFILFQIYLSELTSVTYVRHSISAVYYKINLFYIAALVVSKCPVILGRAQSGTKIYTTDTRLSIPPHVMASLAMRLNLGVFRFLPTTHAKANTKQMRSHSSCPTQLLMRDCLHTQTAVHAGNSRT